MQAKRSKTTYEYIRQLKNVGCRYVAEQTFMPDGTGVQTMEDVKNGNFIIPANAHSVEFEYVKFSPPEFKASFECTGRFFADVELVEYASAEKQLLEQGITLANPHGVVLTHFVKVTRGIAEPDKPSAFVEFFENDVIVTGGDNNWQVVTRHPAVGPKPDYLK